MYTYIIGSGKIQNTKLILNFGKNIYKVKIQIHIVLPFQLVEKKGNMLTMSNDSTKSTHAKKCS